MTKDLRVRFASPATLIFFLVLPLVFTAILSGTGGSAVRSAAAPLVLVRDRDGAPAARAVVGLLLAMPDMRVRVVTDPAEILRSSEPDVLVSIEPSVTGQPPHVRLYASPWKSSTETVKEVGAWLESRGTKRPADRAARREASVAGPSAAANGNAGQIITWVLVPLLGLGAGTLAERRKGTLQRALVAPVSRATVTLAPAAAEVAAAIVQIGLLAGFGAAAFGLPWLSHPLELAALSTAFCFAAAALGALLGSFCRTQRQAGFLGLSVAMVLAVLGGCWYPSSLFPAGLRAVTRLDPAGWAMDGFLAVLSPGSPASAWHSAAQLSVFGACALAVTAGLAYVRRDARP